MPGMAYRVHTAAETFALLDTGGQSARMATGNFLDDFYRTKTAEEKYALIQDPLPEVQHQENLRWASYLAAAVDYLCWENHLPVPEWVSRPEYILPTPWFLQEGWRMRAWLLVKTPPPFMIRNIFCGDRELERV